MSRTQPALVLALALLTVPLTSAHQSAVEPLAAAPVSTTRIRADVEFLADDLLEGREAATRGYDLAARYAAAALEAAGCAPAADDGTDMQQGALRERTPTTT